MNTNRLIEIDIGADVYSVKSISDLEVSLRAGYDASIIHKKFFKNLYALPVLNKYGIFPSQDQLDKYYRNSNCVYPVPWGMSSEEYEAKFSAGDSWWCVKKAECARQGELYDFWKGAGYTESATAREALSLAKVALSNKKQRTR